MPPADFLLTTVCCIVPSTSLSPTLQQWEKDWLMSLNPDKCEVIRITNKKKIIYAKYTIHGQVLPELQIKKNSCQTLGPASKRVLPDLSTFCQTYFFLEFF
jgi:hypothetical protein